MTNIEKAVKILKSINNVDDLPVHHRKILAAALSGEIGEDTGARLVFEDLYEKLTSSSAEAE